MSDISEEALRPLVERMTQALAGGSSANAAAEGGVRALERALAGDRSSAFELLVADALITLACVDAAGDGLPDALGAEHFAALLEV